MSIFAVVAVVCLLGAGLLWVVWPVDDDSEPPYTPTGGV